MSFIDALPIVFIVFLVFCSAFFSSSETALFSLSSTKVRAYSHSKDRKRRLVATLLSRPQDLLVTIFIMNTIVNVLLQSAVSGTVGEEGGWGVKVVLPFLILLFFGEIFPKQFGLEKNEWLATKVARAVDFSQAIIRPVKDLFVTVTAPISKLLFFYLRRDSDFTPDELKHALKKSQELGILHPEEAELADGYLEMTKSSVREIMRPKEEIIAFNMEEALTKIVHLFVDQECTRIPIYQHSLDQVMGILNAKDYFVYRDKIKQPLDLVPLLKRPFFCPETASAKALLKQFDQNGEVFALAVNEYGVITGVITKEDLIELVVGAIVDRRDSTSYYTSAGKEAIIAMGQMEMEEIEEYFSVTLEVPSQVQTLGGWLTDRLGDIPPAGQVHQEGGLLFKVLSATPSRVKKVHISKGGS